MLSLEKFKKGLYSTLYFCGLKLASLFKMNLIIGSKMAFFSVSSFMQPLAGKLLGKHAVYGLFGFSIIFSLLKGSTSTVCCLYGLPIPFNILYGFPSFCAALYTAHESKQIRLFLPLLCIILFVLHPVGRQVIPYSFYWLIPVVLYFVKRRSLFSDALGATFVAHAVGSVCWLYLIPMPVAYWWGLIPVVAFERLSFAVGAVIFYTCCRYAQELYKIFKNEGMSAGVSLFCEKVRG